MAGARRNRARAGLRKTQASIKVKGQTQASFITVALFLSIRLWLVNESLRAMKQSKGHMLPAGSVMV